MKEALSGFCILSNITYGLHVCIRFSQPPNSLFKKDEVDSVQTLFWSNMDKHAEYAEVQYNQVDNTPISNIYYLQYLCTCTLYLLNK